MRRGGYGSKRGFGRRGSVQTGDRGIRSLLVLVDEQGWESKQGGIHRSSEGVGRYF